jgi:hypothetical protein
MVYLNPPTLHFEIYILKRAVLPAFLPIHNQDAL